MSIHFSAFLAALAAVLVSWLFAIRPCRAPLLLLALMLPNLARAKDTESSAPGTIDTELIFGFAEGADIGEKGERELEITATGLAGKLGQYAGIQNETALRYGVADGFRASIGALTDYHAIAGVPDLADLHSLNVFAGVSSEFRWQFLNRFSSPLDLTLSLSRNGSISMIHRAKTCKVMSYP